MKLLVVDDQEAVSKIVAEIAAQGGWQTVHSSDVKEALDLVYRSGIDVLLIDYMMPEMTGLDFISDLRQKGNPMPAVIFSAVTGEIDTELASRLGVVTILKKPLRISDLRKALADCVKIKLANASSQS
ncbi:MAG: response regulator [bacterium]